MSVKMLSICPFCKYACNEVTGPNLFDENAEPETGDISLCIRCGEWGVFDFGLPEQMRKPTSDEYDEIAAGKIYRRMRKAWLEVMKEKDGPNRQTRS